MSCASAGNSVGFGAIGNAMAPAQSSNNEVDELMARLAALDGPPMKSSAHFEKEKNSASAAEPMSHEMLAEIQDCKEEMKEVSPEPTQSIPVP